MIRIGIIDDEKHARDAMRAMLSRIDEELTVVFEAADVETAIASISGNAIDLLFLDIHLQSGNGFQILEQLPEKLFEVVFVTAYNQYAIEAFQFAALNYILKPVKLSDVRESISRINSRSYIVSNNDQLQVVSNNFGIEDVKQKKITLPCANEYVIINIQKIIRLEANSNYTWFIIEDNQKYLVCRTLKEYERLLFRNGFFRIHQSHIVNLNHVTKFHKSNGGEVIMSDGSKIPIGRNKKDELFKLFRT